MENKTKKTKVDYAAIIREYEMYGRGRSLKQFCDDSDYVYPKYFVIIASAFMFSIIESCNMNKLSPGWYIKELVSCLTAKPCSDVEKVAILPCIIQK